MEKSKFFVTTPVYYVNDIPHIGHTYTTVAADVVARFWKQLGYDARLLTGTDEHGAKIAAAAKNHNKEPKEYADEISAEFKKAWQLLDIDFSRFIRTTDEDHIKVSQDFLQKLYDTGAIDPKPRLYKGLYCIGCEKFLSQNELKDGLCPDHLKPPVEHSEENYYFKLSAYQDRLIELIKNEDGKGIEVQPAKRKHEMLSKLELGLEDISISRANLEWGIPLPFDESHTTYVWIEALINYYTYGSPNKVWPADLHLVGKDIVWFHAVIWPAMLLAIGEQPPKQVFGHGFFTISGQKMSKSLGNVIKPSELVARYGVEGTRYVLLSAFPFGEDGDFSWETFDQLYNANLANGLGNLASRVSKLLELNKVTISQDQENIKPSLGLSELYSTLSLDQVLRNISEKVSTLDQKLNEWHPWETKDPNTSSNWNEIVQGIRQIACDLYPFLPETSTKIRDIFSGPDVKKPEQALFPRLEVSS